MSRTTLVIAAIVLAISACSVSDDPPAARDTTPTATSPATNDAGSETTETAQETTPPTTPPPAATTPATAAPSATTPPTTESTDSTVAESADTTALPVNPPEIADPATDIDWSAIVQQLIDTIDRIPRELSINLVDAACAPDSACYAENLNVIETLTAQGTRLEGGLPGKLVSVEYAGTVGDVPFEEAAGIVLLVTQQGLGGDPFTLVDESGNVVQELDNDIAPGEQFEQLWVVARSADGTSWLQFSSTSRG